MGQPGLQRFGARHEPRHRGEGELQAHTARGIGVEDKERQQGKAQARGAVLIPPGNGRREQNRLHEHRAQGRRARPGHQGIEEQQRNGRRSVAPPPAQAQHHRREKGHVHTRYRHRMGHPRPLHGGGGLPGKAGAVPGENGHGQRRGLAGEGPVKALLQGPGAPRGEVAQAVPMAGLRHRTLAVAQQKNALGGIIGGLVPPPPVGGAQGGGEGHTVAGDKGAPVLAAVHQHIRGGKAAVQRHHGAVSAGGGALGIGAHTARKGKLLPGHGIRRGAEHRRPQGKPPEGRPKAQADGQGTPDRIGKGTPEGTPPPQKQHGGRAQRQKGGKGAQHRPGRAGDIAQHQAHGPKAGGKPRKPPHFTAPPFRPRRPPGPQADIFSILAGLRPAVNPRRGHISPCAPAPGQVYYTIEKLHL